MASRFNKKSNITLGKNSEDWMDAKSMGAFINEALESHKKESTINLITFINVTAIKTHIEVIPNLL